MSVGRASIARAVNAEKTAKTEEKATEVKVAEAAEKPTEIKTETGEKAAEKTAAKKTTAKSPAKKTITKATAKKTTTRKTTPRKSATAKTAAAEKPTGTVAQNVISGGNADELQAVFHTRKKEEPANNQPVGIKDELPVYLL